MRPRPRTRRPAGTIALFLALTVALGGCSTPWGNDLAWPWQEPDPLPTPTRTVPATAPDRRATPPDPVPKPVYWPLTGHQGKKAAMGRPALSVKIENAPEARPTTGLEDADIVWEEVVEGGITRFVAVYHSRIPDAVEPVRSIRPMDAEIVAPLRGVLAYSGGQPPFIAQIGKVGTQSVVMDDGDPGFRRDPNRAAPHNVIGSPEVFMSQARGDRETPPPAQFSYAHEGEGSASAHGHPASHLRVTLSGRQTTNWTWDGASGTYLRSEGVSPSWSSSGARHAATNVLSLKTEVVDTEYRDPAGFPVPRTKMVGKGTGLLASSGKAVTVHWSKKNAHAPIRLTLTNGEKAHLTPGPTWIELVPTTTGTWTID